MDNYINMTLLKSPSNWLIITGFALVSILVIDFVLSLALSSAPHPEKVNASPSAA